MKIVLEHIFPEEWIKALSPEELEVLRKAFEISRKNRLREGARFDFFGGAMLDLDHVYVSPERGASLVDSLSDFVEEHEARQVA